MREFDHLYIKPTDVVEWGSPKTIRQLIAQLQTMDPEIKVYGVTHTEYDGKRVARCRPPTMSFERVEAPWIRSKNHDVPYALVFWTGEDDGTRTPPEIPTNAPQSGIERAARFVEKRRDEYVQDHGSYDPDTGATEFPGDGLEYVAELEEIIDGIRALASQEAAKP